MSSSLLDYQLKIINVVMETQHNNII